MRVITLFHSSGGVGRTTSAVNLAAALADTGTRTLLIDLDPAADTSASLGIPAKATDLTAADILTAPEHAAANTESLIWSLTSTLSVIPAGHTLLKLDTHATQLATSHTRDQRLRMFLESLPEQPQAVVIDTPAALGVLSLNAIYAADTLIMPCRTDAHAARSATRSAAIANAAINALNPAPPQAPSVYAVPRIHGPSDQHDTAAAHFIANCPVPTLSDPDGSGVLVLPYDDHADQAAALAEPLNRLDPAPPLAHAYAALAQSLLHTPRPNAILEAKPKIDTESDSETRRSISSPRPSLERPTTHRSAGAQGHAHSTLAEPKLTPGADSAPDPSGLTHRAAELAARVDTVKRITRASNASRLADPRVRAAMDNTDHTDPKPDAARSLFGVRATSRGLLFVVDAPEDATVEIRGTFNAWQPSRASFNPVLAAHELLAHATPGTHRYAVSVNGTTHTITNQHTIDCPTHGPCGVITAIKPRHATVA